MGAYARGSKAWGICQRCGLRALLNDLVLDGYYPWLRVHSECFEAKHPQERLVNVVDPIALWRPSPEVGGPTPPVLVSNVVGSDVELTWSESIGGDSQIEQYLVYRTAVDADPALITTLLVERDWNAAILVNPLDYTDESVPAGTYDYHVVAMDANHRAAASNTETEVIP